MGREPSWYHHADSVYTYAQLLTEKRRFIMEGFMRVEGILHTQCSSSTHQHDNTNKPSSSNHNNHNNNNNNNNNDNNYYLFLLSDLIIVTRYCPLLSEHEDEDTSSSKIFQLVVTYALGNLSNLTPGMRGCSTRVVRCLQLTDRARSCC
jgi:hypothetical protein